MTFISKVSNIFSHMSWIKWIFIAAFAVLLLILPFLPFPQVALWVRILGYAGLYILLGLGLLIHVGFAGLLDLGFAAYYGIGAYLYGIFASQLFDMHVPFWIMLLAGGLVAALVGALISVPVLRLRGDYLAIVTLGFGEITRLLLLNLRTITNGSQGIIRIDKPVLFGMTFNTGTHFYFLIIALIVFFVFITIA